jgi:hypothetical protein
MQFRCFIKHLALVDGHSLLLAKIFSPGGYHVVQTEQAGAIQAFVKSALERPVASTRSLNLFHSKPFSILASNPVFDGYCDWPILVLREDGEIVCRIKGRCINAGFSGEVDRKSKSENQSSER